MRNNTETLACPEYDAYKQNLIPNVAGGLFRQLDSLLTCRLFFFQVTQKSGARVRVLSDSGESGCQTAVCFLLQGSKDQILLARCVLENLVIDCEPVTETLEVPQTAFGRIIGSFQILSAITLISRP